MYLPANYTGFIQKWLDITVVLT